MRNFKIILVLFLIVSQILQAQEVEKKQKKTVVRKELNKRDVEKKKTEVPSNKVALKKKSRKREHPASDSITNVFLVGKKIYPNTFKHITTYPANSHLGDKVHSEGVQGLAHSPTNWYWTRASWKMTKKGRRERSYIYKMRANHMSRRVKVEGVPSEIWKKGYHHLSDPDYYKGYIYVPIEIGKHDLPVVPIDSIQYVTPKPSLILVYDKDLNFLGSAPLSFHKDSEDIHSGGAWCAINPTNGLLYVSRGSGKGSDSNYSVLDVYDPILDVDAETQGGVFKLYYRHSVKLKFSNNWNARTYIQGGVFSPDGLFYYVMDPKHKYDLHSQSGVHVFEINGKIGTEISVTGKSINAIGHLIETPGKVANHLSVQYGIPNELEGLDFVSPNEWIYKVLLNNMRDINVPSLISDTKGTTTGFLLLTRLYNDFGREDTVNLIHYQLINKANP